MVRDRSLRLKDNDSGEITFVNMLSNSVFEWQFNLAAVCMVKEIFMQENPKIDWLDFDHCNSVS